jgi:hypothetical protein
MAPQDEEADLLEDATMTETAVIGHDVEVVAAASDGRKSAKTPTKNEAGARRG